MDLGGECRIERVPLVQDRDVKVVEGYMDDLVHSLPLGSHKRPGPYLLHDKGAILSPMGKLRQVIPNTMAIDRPEFIGESRNAAQIGDHRTSDVTTLFRDFFVQVTGEPASDEEAATFAEIVEEMERTEHEVKA